MEAERDLAGEFLALVKDMHAAAKAGTLARADVITLVTGAAIFLDVPRATQGLEAMAMILQDHRQTESLRYRCAFALGAVLRGQVSHAD